MTFNLANGSDIMCCNSTGGMLPASALHPACLPIEVSTNDPFYARIRVKRTCMNFVRTIGGVRNNCSLGYADQVTEGHSIQLNFPKLI